MTQDARRVSFFVFLSLAIAAAAFAAKPISEPPATADMNISAAAIQWQPSGSFERMALVVSGPGDFSFTKEFPAGATPALHLQDLGAKVADGSYTWEIRVIPRVSAETRAQLTAARAANDDAAVARIKAEAGLDRETTISGGFMVMSGSFVSNKGEEPPAPGGKKVIANGLGNVKAEDVVTADDAIIQGSLCVGHDCVNNESFGFDTIRLKENNTRIKFDDTSTTAGCPNNDWQLTANDTCGGSNKFSIEDITGAKVPFTLIAGAPTNSLFVASSGKVGFGNSSPGLNLHITATDTPAIRQEQTSGGGFTAQTWDIGANEANWFVRDVTGGSRLPLRIRPGAPTSSIDIAASGKVGVGTASPASNLHVFGTSTTDVFIGLGEDPAGTTGTQSALTIGYGGNSVGRGTGFFNVRPDSNAVAPNPSLRFFTANVQRAIIDFQGFLGLGVAAPAFPIDHSSGAHLTAGGVWTNASSRAFKQDISNLDSTEAMATLKNLQPVKYSYKIDPTEHHVGFIAEDVPDLVATPDRKSLSPMDIVGVLTKVVQQQQSTIDDLKARIDQLEAKKQ